MAAICLGLQGAHKSSIYNYYGTNRVIIVQFAAIVQYNTLVVVSINANDNIGKVLAEMMSICCICVKNEANRILSRYKSLKQNLLDATPSEKEIIAQYKHNLKNITIPNDIEHYTEIMKLHIEIIDILEKVNKQ